MIAALLALQLAAAAPPGELRMGVFVGNDEGRSGQERLLFATADAAKMRDLFVGAGGVAPEDALLLLDRPRRDVELALSEASAKLRAASDEGRPTSLVFYYSGHGDEAGLRLGSTTLTHEVLRERLEASGADLRVAFLDACQSGGAIREKGGARGPAHAFAVEAASARGTAILTSSAASEFSQESQELGGGFFTHYLHAALLGAADRDGDDVVTLNETYAWVHGETAFHTRTTPGTQTPSFDFDLSGAGEVALTRLARAEATLVFAGDLDGTYAVWDATRRRYVAEVRGGAPTALHLPAGAYHVHHRMPGWVDEAAYALGRGDSVTVSETDFLSLAWEDTTARGDLSRQARKAMTPRLTLAAVVGARGFGAQSVAARQYLPAHVIGGVQARFLGVRKGPYWGFDVLTGGGTGQIAVPGGATKTVQVWSYGAGGVAGWATGAAAVLRAGAGGRVELVHLGRSFPGEDTPPQGTTRVAPGLNGWIGLHPGRVHVDLGVSAMLLPVQWDGHPMPGLLEIHLSFGYRF